MSTQIKKKIFYMYIVTHFTVRHYVNARRTFTLCRGINTPPYAATKIYPINVAVAFIAGIRKYVRSALILKFFRHFFFRISTDSLSTAKALQFVV